MNITLGNMRPGNWRMLTDAELNTLLKSLDAGESGAPEEEE
jgi:16S rRNA U516 pseudouridylate synthase RsuA-like enzyme